MESPALGVLSAAHRAITRRVQVSWGAGGRVTGQDWAYTAISGWVPVLVLLGRCTHPMAWALYTVGSVPCSMLWECYCYVFPAEANLASQHPMAPRSPHRLQHVIPQDLGGADSGRQSPEC